MCDAALHCRTTNDLVGVLMRGPAKILSAYTSTTALGSNRIPLTPLRLAAGVLILSEFTGASQSLGAGAILVNPWNITDLSAAIGDALTMTDAERRERHRQNYMHITIHTSQTWADTFISELNDTHVEAELRTKHIPPQVLYTTAMTVMMTMLKIDDGVP